MYKPKRFRVFQEEGREALASQSQMIATSYAAVEYALQGDGPAVLVSHGSFGGFDQGLSSMYFLKDSGVRFVIPSRFGYLRSPMPVDSSPQAQALAYAALLDALGIDRVWLIGLSAGGMASIQFALQFPSRCRGLILISAITCRMPLRPPVRFMIEHVLTNEFLGWALATYAPSLVARSTGDDYALVAGDPALKAVFLSLAWPSQGALRRAGMLNDMRQVRSLPNFPFEKIAVPTLVIHGDADPLAPFGSAEQLAAQVNGASMLAFPGGGHLSFLTHQQETRHAIFTFIGS